jgi:fatty acid/phospholipid biosynthesis enzyme
MKSNGRPLVPYLRQSRLKERTISIEEQRRDIQAWAQANGVPLAAEVTEQRVSGSKPWRERDLGDAVDACERGEASGIISPGRTGSPARTAVRPLKRGRHSSGPALASSPPTRPRHRKRRPGDAVHD